MHSESVNCRFGRSGCLGIGQVFAELIRLSSTSKLLWFSIASLMLAGAVFALSMHFVWQRALASQLGLGQAIYSQHCASCHGNKLEGQANWQSRNAAGRMPAPPHDDTGHTWHHSDEQLFKITKFGVSAIVPSYESDMGGFEGKLSDAEIQAVLNFIKSTWSEPHKDYQAERSRYQQ
jgi:mono/diheme cytochrome c family protein